MKTITLQGEFQKFENLNQAISKFDEDRLPYKVETRVYVVRIYGLSDNIYDTETLSNEEFMTESEKQGLVYTLQGFETAVNKEGLYLNASYIRFISVPLF